MSYFKNVTLGAIGDGPQIDAFGRLRVSEPYTIFDSKQIFDDGDIANSAENYPLFYDNQQTSGSGTSTTFNAARASTILAVSNTTAGVRVRQTRQRFNYQPGKSQLALLTAIWGTGASGITKRYGLFDDNNGLFFELNGTTFYAVKRSGASGSPVDTKVAQNDWNLDPLNGNGPSGKSLDLTKTLIMIIDYEWLGVGRVRFGFVIGGGIYYCHEFLHSNLNTAVYMSTPNLPIRASITNDGTGAAASFEEICASVSSEGGFEPHGIVRSHDNGITGVTAGTSPTALLGIRLRSTHLGATIVPESMGIIVTTNDTMRWSLLYNPTVASTFTYANLANSCCQIATGVAANTITGGTKLASGYVSSQGRQADLPTEIALRIGADIANTPGTLVLAAQALTGTLVAYGSFVWREVF